MLPQRSNGIQTSDDAGREREIRETIATRYMLRPMSGRGAVLYTIGYEQRSVNELAKALKRVGVERLVDVRLTPHSRKKGYSLMSLFQTLHRVGIAYDHVAQLGNPPEIRDDFKNGDLVRGRARYRALLTNGRGEEVEKLARLAKAQPTAILCLEHEPEHCHRDVIANLARERYGLEIVHL